MPRLLLRHKNTSLIPSVSSALLARNTMKESVQYKEEPIELPFIQVDFYQSCEYHNGKAETALGKYNA